MKKIIAALLLSVSSVTFAKGPTEVIIPFPPGGGVDIVFKNLQAYAANNGVTLVPNYKPGADGIIAARELANDKKASRLGLFPASTMGNVVSKEPNYTYKAITGLRSSVFGFAVRSESTISDLETLRLRVRAGANISFGYGAPGQLNVIEQYLGLVKTHPDRPPLMVPYKGAAPAIVDAIAGTIDVIAVPLVTIDSQIASGKLKLLATTGRTKKYPNVPSLTDVYKDWQQYEMFGVVANEDMPAEEVAMWTQFLKKYMSDIEVKESFEKEFTNISPFGPKAYNSAVAENARIATERNKK